MTKIGVEELPGVNCGLCGFRTCEELADKLLEGWRDPQAAERRAEAAGVLADRHTWRAVARQILDWRARRVKDER